ncbi:MAG: 7-cyano-7-deazaguanine synthase [Alphaproteobacteria bacterium]|nr:7-cyano-7-deazaguanine synthase [Alphaproteobacteria bacterium]
MNQNFLDFIKPFLHHRLAVAVSGGVDSIALLHWLVAVGADIVVLHVNHGLRAASADEEEYVRTSAAALGVP